MNDKSVLKAQIDAFGGPLEALFPFVNGKAYLSAMATVESAFGALAVPKYEKAYDLGGPYADYQGWLKYGAHYACSYSSFQIMYPVACELGFKGTPYELQMDQTAIIWVIELFSKRGIKQKLSSVEEMADFYNSGSARDKIIPTKYIQDIRHQYDLFVGMK